MNQKKRRTLPQYVYARGSGKGTKYEAVAYAEGKLHHVGYYDSPEKASAARDKFLSRQETRTAKPKRELPRFVYRITRSKKFEAKPTVNGEQVHLGVFDTPEQAAECVELYMSNHPPVVNVYTRRIKELVEQEVLVSEKILHSIRKGAVINSGMRRF